MKRKLLITAILFFASSLFANDEALIERIQNAQYDIKAQSTPIGVDALNQFPDNQEEQLKYIKSQCENILTNFNYLGDENIVKGVVLPNCLEYAMEVTRKN
jgi:hypothetical protein